MKIGRGSATQKSYGAFNIYGQRNIDSIEKTAPASSLSDIGALVTLGIGAENKRVAPLTYSTPTYPDSSDRVFNYKSGTGILDGDVAKMEPGDKIIYKTNTGAAIEYTYKSGDTARDIMHAMGIADTDLSDTPKKYHINNSINKYAANVAAYKAPKHYSETTYSDDYVEVTLTSLMPTNNQNNLAV